MPLPRLTPRTAPAIRLIPTALLTALLVGGGLFALPSPAAAEEPLDVAGVVTDRADALSEAERADVERALEDYFDQTGRRLFVVYVRGFDGLTGPEWADATARESGLGSADILLAVSLGERSYGYSADVDDFTPEELDEVDREFVLPRLRQDDWSGAAIAASRGLADVTGTGVPWGWVLGGVVVVGIGAAVTMTALRRRFDHSHHVVDESGRPIDPADILTDAELEDLANTALVGLDDALSTSAFELGYADAQLGVETTARFHRAIDDGRARLGEAFALKQRIDDAEPTSDSERRRMLSQIATICEEADAELDALAGAFDELRDLPNRMPDALTAVESRLSDVHDRLGVHDQTSGARTEGISQARDLVACGDAQALAGRSGLEAGPTAKDRPAAVAHLRAAEEAVAQAVALLDAHDQVGSALRSVSTYVTTHRGAVEVEARTRLSEADRLLRASDSSDRAEALLRQARTAAEADVAAWRARVASAQDPVPADVAPLVLAGILLEPDGGRPRTTRSSGRRRAPGSFGGSGTRARHHSRS